MQQLSELLVEHVEPGHVRRIQSTRHHRFHRQLAFTCRALRCKPSTRLFSHLKRPDSVEHLVPNDVFLLWTKRSQFIISTKWRGTSRTPARERALAITPRRQFGIGIRCRYLSLLIFWVECACIELTFRCSRCPAAAP